MPESSGEGPVANNHRRSCRPPPPEAATSVARTNDHRVSTPPEGNCGRSTRLIRACDQYQRSAAAGRLHDRTLAISLAGGEHSDPAPWGGLRLPRWVGATAQGPTGWLKTVRDGLRRAYVQDGGA